MLTEIQKNILIGGILGDCCVEKNGQNFRIIFNHSVSQLEYITWKHSMVYPYTTNLSKYSVLDTRTNKIYQKVKFKTMTKSFFNDYYSLFYSNNKKTIPTTIKNILHSEIALAIWYLDDGALRTDWKGLRLHTNNFTFNEVCILQNVLLENFKIESKIHKQAQTFNIYVGSTNNQSEKFFNIIKPFVTSEIPSMLYKLL